MQYPTFEKLQADNTPPIPYDLGGHILYALGIRTAPMLTDKGTKRRHVKKAPEERRQYATPYIGVTVTKNKRFVAQWRKPNGVYARGVYRDTPEEAAWDRARVLGLTELEVRE